MTFPSQDGWLCVFSAWAVCVWLLSFPFRFSSISTSHIFILVFLLAFHVTFSDYSLFPSFLSCSSYSQILIFSTHLMKISVSLILFCCIPLHSFHSILSHSILLYFVLLYPLYSTLFHSILLYCVLFYFYLVLLLIFSLTCHNQNDFFWNTDPGQTNHCGLRLKLMACQLCKKCEKARIISHKLPKKDENVGLWGPLKRKYIQATWPS